MAVALLSLSASWLHPCAPFGHRHVARRHAPPLAQGRWDGPDFEDDDFLDQLEEDLRRASQGLPIRRELGGAQRLGSASAAPALDGSAAADGDGDDDDESDEPRAADADADASSSGGDARRRRRLPKAVQRPLARTRRAWAELRDSFDIYTQRPSQQLLLGSLSILLGFYVAQGITPGVVGQGGYWEYVAGGASIFAVERVTIEYYSRPLHRRSPTLRLLQAFKVGFVLGCTLDALKLAG